MLSDPLSESFGQHPARHVAADAFVYLKGNAAQSVYLLGSGLVKISVVWRDGRELIVRLARPGELFGKIGLGAAEYGEHARALEPSEIVEIPAAELVTRMARDPDAVAAVFKEFALRLREARQTIERLAFANTMERLCRVLGKLAHELGEPGDGVVLIPHYIKQEDVARMTGARREVVSGLLNRLREKGVISYSRKGALRLDRDNLDRVLRSFRKGRQRGKQASNVRPVLVGLRFPSSDSPTWSRRVRLGRSHGSIPSIFVLLSAPRERLGGVRRAARPD